MEGFNVPICFGCITILFLTNSFHKKLIFSISPIVPVHLCVDIRVYTAVFHLIATSYQRKCKCCHHFYALGLLFHHLETIGNDDIHEQQHPTPKCWNCNVSPRLARVPMQAEANCEGERFYGYYTFILKKKSNLLRSARH